MLQPGTKVRLLHDVDEKYMVGRKIIPAGTIGEVIRHLEENEIGKHPACYEVLFHPVCRFDEIYFPEPDEIEEVI